MAKEGIIKEEIRKRFVKDSSRNNLARRGEAKK